MFFVQRVVLVMQGIDSREVRSVIRLGFSPSIMDMSQEKGELDAMVLHRRIGIHMTCISH